MRQSNTRPVLRTRRPERLLPAAILAVCGLAAATAQASYFPNYVYDIHRAGLYGPQHTSSAGRQTSGADFHSSGWVAGRSTRYTVVNNINGQDTWVYNPVTNTTVQTGLTGGVYTGSAGFQQSVNNFQNQAAQVAGRSYRFTGGNTFNGGDTWVYNPVTNTTVQTGLTGGVYTGSAGWQESLNNFQNQAGQVAGYSVRYTGVSTINGRDTWVYNSVTNTTVQTGLTGGAYTGSAGRQESFNNFQNQAGQVAGYSLRYTGVNTDNGRDAWVYNPFTNTTTQIGFTGTGYTGSAGFQFSFSNFQNEAGQVAGYSVRRTGVDTYRGVDTWVYNPVTNTTTQIGFTGAGYTGSAGFQFSLNNFQNQAGQVAGISNRYTGVSTFIGEDTWVYNPVTNTTVQTGFTGGVYTGSAGFQVSENNFLNEAGQVAGRSVRYTGVNTVNGRDTWVYNPVTNTTVQTGLTGGVYTGSAGFQQSVNNFLNQAGQVAGYSQRRTGVSSTFNGEDTWVYNPVTNTTVQTGLTGGVYTGSAGYQSSQNNFQNEAGHVAGRSNRVTGVNTFNGQDTWVYNPVTNTTVQTGLTGGDYTGSAGYQVSVNNFQNQAGQVAGNSRRYTGVSTQIGQDAWYFDPFTQNTYQPTLGVADSIRTSDNFAFSSISLLTDDGFALGYYSVFAGGLDPAVDRAFIFRPDLGFSDLGDLVDGGLAAAGWDTLLRPQFESVMQYIVGSGYFAGQTGSSQSVFVMKLIPAPSGLALLGLGGLLAAGRRRR